ncbi:GTPase [Coprinopsis cinerea okayama7|uniref:GTPase n=1 Tax=Coprinopsis cinerea (strain Okayama-7 / 130 / ATCC MYA-4618 / FGSC 9003) TaxID=240176 RepID=A8NZR9_COPC7|nr:GTPase [Coprinopsis cinerea okayama7\|eukprot:XP_001837733.1 GTPase [Coprinopsis cinerea okayama7\
MLCGINSSLGHSGGAVCWRLVRANLFVTSSLPRFNSTVAGTSAKKGTRAEEDEEAFRRRRKTEWKRRQGGQTFLDHVIVTVRAGKGGDGCAAFHREKFKPYGPPSGGNGGRGADVYILPTPHLTTLSSVPKKIRAENGTHGQGAWQNGKSAPPYVLRVPLGTIVREIPLGDPRRAKDEWEAEEESLEGLGPDERKIRMREKRWLHYPGAADSNVDRESFLEAEAAHYKLERERRIMRRKRALEEPIYLDLDKEVKAERPVDAPLGTKQRDPLGYLVASGGQGGAGNTHFLTTDNRSPKYATRGQEGERITLELELKLLADVGLVGMPNAGKSTLLRALTGGRAKTEVANYPFTTLNPVVGIVRVAEDGTWEGSISGPGVHDETIIEEQQEAERMFSGEYAFARTRNEKATDDEYLDKIGRGHHFDVYESFRFTISDNPGLISRASENHGLGHSFLRAMERSPALVYVIDLSAPDPWNELIVLRDELEKYEAGMSTKARMVIANKADLLAEGGDEEAVRAAKEKLKRLEEFVKTQMVLPDGRNLEVVPTSAKYSQNLDKIVALMKQYVMDAREQQP